MSLSVNVSRGDMCLGWINDENPIEKAAKTAATKNFQTPIDEVRLLVGICPSRRRCVV